MVHTTCVSSFSSTYLFLTLQLLKYYHQRQKQQPKSCYSPTAFLTVSTETPMWTKDPSLKGPLKLGSPHFLFWDDAIKKFNSIRFVTDTGGAVNVPSLENLRQTLVNFKVLFEILTDHGFKKIDKRSFNQDSLENFFGIIRSRGGRNTNPCRHMFAASYKTLCINNFMGIQSPIKL